ncbi:hypothetical protein ACNOYE_35005 [Nannocystaceae bacterium ST9]
MSRRRERVLFAIVVAILLAAHMLRFGQDGRPLLFGWMPIDFAYRIAWLAAATGVVFWMTGRLWSERE